MSEETIQDTGSPEATSTAAPVGFLDSLPEDLRNEPSLRLFSDPASLAKSYVHAQRMIGASMKRDDARYPILLTKRFLL